MTSEEIKAVTAARLEAFKKIIESLLPLTDQDRRIVIQATEAIFAL